MVPPFDVEKRRVFRFGVGIPNWSSSCTLNSLVPGFNLLPLIASIKDDTCPLILVSTRLLLQYIGKRFLLFREIFVPSIDVRTTSGKERMPSKIYSRKTEFEFIFDFTRHLLPSLQVMHAVLLLENTKQ